MSIKSEYARKGEQDGYKAGLAVKARIDNVSDLASSMQKMLHAVQLAEKKAYINRNDARKLLPIAQKIGTAIIKIFSLYHRSKSVLEGNIQGMINKAKHMPKNKEKTLDYLNEVEYEMRLVYGHMDNILKMVNRDLMYPPTPLNESRLRVLYKYVLATSKTFDNMMLAMSSARMAYEKAARELAVAEELGWFK